MQARHSLSHCMTVTMVTVTYSDTVTVSVHDCESVSDSTWLTSQHQKSTGSMYPPPPTHTPYSTATVGLTLGYTVNL